MFQNKTLFITGGTGSFGNAVLRCFLDSDFSEIRIFSRGEKKQEDMWLSLRDDRVKFHNGDVRDYNAVDDVMRGVGYVLHAAALKQVPSCEFYPMEAMRGLFLSQASIKVIGTLHGEKLYELLVSREEMVRAEDLGDYYRIPADSRDLNYDKYFVEGEREIAEIEDYTSHNSRRFDVEGVRQILLSLNLIQGALRA
ncbi:polysaccharide biosynthesis protein [Aurantimonas sp. E1-2-R+4]|uniref:polysaccharide biosynthesis protein n=1 Tax=Aurantimonas sp. E1-2-R+4 TaxID=3113714 RepID=UPI002F941BE1